MLRKFLHTTLLLLLGQVAIAQQFIGFMPDGYTAIQQMPYNPAWVNNARTGTEFNIVGLSLFAGNNAYYAKKNVLFNPAGDTALTEGKDYFEVATSKNRRGWVNADILGPAVSFKYNNQYQVGVYTRFRTIVNAGNLTDYQFDVYTDTAHPDYFKHTMNFIKAGVTAHAFGEVGISLGKMLRDDEYYKMRVGVNIKYLVGWAAVNINANDLTYSRDHDTMLYADGDLTAQYTYNTNPSDVDLSTRAGKGGLGLDVGIQYEFHPDGDPNAKTPYQWSVSASITDIGSVAYVGDKGSAVYDVHSGRRDMNDLNMLDVDHKEFGFYGQRMVDDTAISVTEKQEKFRIGLPTALRLNADWYLGTHLFVSMNTLLNLKGHGKKVYRAGYVSYLNLTPRVDWGNVKIGLPMTLIKYKTFTMGTIFYLGPLYIGSTTLLSAALIGTNIRNVDIYTGLTFKVTHRDHDRLRSYDNGYDGRSFWQKLVPGFLRGDNSIYCPPSRL